MQKLNVTNDYAIVVGGFSSGALYAKELAQRGIPPVHVPAAPKPPAAYVSQKLPAEFADDLPFEEELEQTVERLRSTPYCQYRPRLVVAGTDQGVARADRLAEILGLPSNGSALSDMRRDKFLATEQLRRAGLNTPLQFRGQNPCEAASWVASHPEISCWVVKPTRSAGSDRVFRCHTTAQVENAASKIVGGTNVFGEDDRQFLVQEFLTCATDGNEYVVNTCSAVDPKNGEEVHRVVSIYRYEKIALNGAPFVYHARYLLPASGDTQRQISEYFLKCISALGVRIGPCHGELRMTDRGPAVVEVNIGRPDGGGVPELDASCIGRNQVGLCVDAFLDPATFVRDARLPYELQKQGIVAFFASEHDGVLLEMPGREIMRNLRSYLNGVFLVRPGEKVHRTVDVSTLVGWVFLCHEDRDQLTNDYLAVRNLERNGLFEIALET